MRSVVVQTTLPTAAGAAASQAATDRRHDTRDICITPEKLAASVSRLYGIDVSTKTLANWRSKGKGPAFIKIGRRVTYNLHEVNRWFQAQRRTRTKE